MTTVRRTETVNARQRPRKAGRSLPYDYLEDGILRDPKHPRGVSIDDWLSEYGRINKIDISSVLDAITIRPFK